MTDLAEFRKDLGLKNQLRRAAISVLANIAAGFAHESQAQFISYLGRTKGEVRCQLYLAFDLKYLPEDKSKMASLMAGKCSRQTYRLRDIPNAPRVK